jgi:hypothetical protein
MRFVVPADRAPREPRSAGQYVLNRALTVAAFDNLDPITDGDGTRGAGELPAEPSPQDTAPLSLIFIPYCDLRPICPYDHACESLQR